MFQGFSQQTIDFMWGIRFNNSREWFLQHKNEYLEHFYQPMKELCTAVQTRFLSQRDDLQLNSKVSRIYRDARRVKYGGFYKDHLWLSLREPADDSFPRPAFYLEVRPEGYETGLVYWTEQPALMQHYRRTVQRAPEKLEQLAQYLNSQGNFILTGAEYKRSKGEVSDLLKPWFNRKEIIISRFYPYENNCPFFSQALTDVVVNDFVWLLPFFHYLQQVELDYHSFLLEN